MIYTVANKEETEKKLEEKAKEGQRVYKAGLSAAGRARSPGGAVWQSRAEAAAWLASKREELQAKLSTEEAQAIEALKELEGLAVYGVEGDWERDCMQYDHEPFRRLIIDRPIVGLE